MILKGHLPKPVPKDQFKEFWRYKKVMIFQGDIHMEYLELLREFGCDLNTNEYLECFPQSKEQRSCDPVGYAGGLPQFSLQQVALFGRDMDEVGEYEVLDVGPDYVMDYGMETSAQKTKIHRYDRCYRFRWTFSHLIACNGKASLDLLREIRARVTNDVLHSRKCFEAIRECLKALGMPKSYISIPYIIRALGGPRWVITHDQIGQISSEGQLLCRLFNQVAQCLGRKRFPKMMFVCMKLMEKYRVVSPYKIY